jgi:hypothetical protein
MAGTSTLAYFLADRSKAHRRNAPVWRRVISTAQDPAGRNSLLPCRAGAIRLARIVPIDHAKHDVRVKGYHRVRP